MTIETASALQTLQLPQGRKRASVRKEILHAIETGETSLFRFIRGYIIASLWSSLDDEGTPLDCDFSISDLATEALVSAWAECSHFRRENETNLTHLDDDLNGHNFWLVRNRYGSGFWDESVSDESAEFAMLQLTHASHTYGEVDLYIGDDHKLHFSNERSIL